MVLWTISLGNSVVSFLFSPKQTFDYLTRRALELLHGNTCNIASLVLSFMVHTHWIYFFLVGVVNLLNLGLCGPLPDR